MWSSPELTHRFPTALQEAFYRHEYCSLGRQQELNLLTACLQGGYSDRTRVYHDGDHEPIDRQAILELESLQREYSWEAESRTPSNAE